MILKLLLVVLFFLAAILLIAALRSSKFVVARSITINAPSSRIHPLLDDFHNWPLWSPQDKEDPSMQRSFRGSPSGVGAISAWTSKGSAGAGEMTITSSSPQAISVQVNWTKPFRLQNRNDFTLQPNADGPTAVTWTLNGSSPYLLKLIGIFISPDRMMGKHFERGLQNLKSVAER